jgi:hypothetical protein
MHVATCAQHAYSGDNTTSRPITDGRILILSLEKLDVKIRTAEFQQ